MVHETILSRMVKDFGDLVMSTITSDLYGSGLAHLVIFVGGVAALLHLAFSLQKGSAPTKSVMFFAAWFACLPVRGKPLAYLAVNGLGTSLAYAIQKSSVKILDRTRPSGKTMAPGWVINALFRAASAEITDSTIQSRVGYLLENCIPNVSNREGDSLTAADLFGGKIVSNGGGAAIYRERFDPKYLRARSIETPGGSFNCYDLLVATRTQLRRHLAGKSLTKLPSKVYVGSTAGEELSSSDEMTEWAEPSTTESQRIRQVALNLATATAVQKAAAGHRDPSSWVPGPGKWVRNNLNSATHAQLAEPAQQNGLLTSITFDVMSTPLAIMRSLEVDGNITSGMLLHEMNEKLLSLPYYVAFVQSILKILVPIAVLTMFLGTFKIFLTWSFVWILTLIMPAIINLSRGLSNSILYQTNKIDDYARILTTEPGFLAQGIDFSAANQIVADSSRMMMTILSVETGIWAALLVMVPAGAWFAGNIANQAAKTIGGGIVSGVAFGTGQALYRSAAKVSVKAAAPVVGGAVAAGRRVMASGMRTVSHAYHTVSYRNPGPTVSTKPEANIKKHMDHMAKATKSNRKERDS